MDVYRREPIIPNKISFGFTIWYMFVSPRVDISLGEAKVYHIDGLLCFVQPQGAISQLYITMQDPSRMHKLKS